jgi:hypothetical protein
VNLGPFKTQNIFRDMKNVIQRNARDKTFRIFTIFCGPGRKNQKNKRFEVFNIFGTGSLQDDYQNIYPKLPKK